MKTTESVLREYIQFEDVNQSETIELLPLTIIDAMDEYANQQERRYSEKDMKLAFETGRNFQLTGENNFNELIGQFKKK
jgi:hypothetical protein